MQNNFNSVPKWLHDQFQCCCGLISPPTQGWLLTSKSKTGPKTKCSRLGEKESVQMCLLKKYLRNDYVLVLSLR